MKAALEPPFDSTPEFQNFTEAMRRLVAVPKEELTQLLKNSKTAKSEKGGSAKNTK